MLFNRRVKSRYITFVNANQFLFPLVFLRLSDSRNLDPNVLCRDGGMHSTVEKKDAGIKVEITVNFSGYRETRMLGPFAITNRILFFFS